MWIFTGIGFASVVADRFTRNPDDLQVRFRLHADAVGFAAKAAQANESKAPKIIITNEADYRFRICLTKLELALTLAQLVDEIDYTNFKDMMHERAPKWHPTLGRIWSESVSIQHSQH